MAPWSWALIKSEILALRRPPVVDISKACTSNGKRFSEIVDTASPEDLNDNAPTVVAINVNAADTPNASKRRARIVEKCVLKNDRNAKSCFVEDAAAACMMFSLHKVPV